MKNLNYKIIKWRDPTSASEWKDTEQIKKWAKETAKETNTSVGVIVYQTKHYLVVAATEDAQGNYGDYTIIYKCLIKSIKTIRRKG